jgi:hypothetical protein
MKCTGKPFLSLCGMDIVVGLLLPATAEWNKIVSAITVETENMSRGALMERQRVTAPCSNCI